MSKSETKDLLKFLKPFPDQTEIVLWLREFVWDLYLKANELIYDNYNALAFGWSPTDKVGHTFCSIAVGRTSHNAILVFTGVLKLLIQRKSCSEKELSTDICWSRVRASSQRPT